MDYLHKKIFYRATHRGTRELDLLMMKFMNALFDDLTQKQKEEFEIIVNQDDDVLESWVKCLPIYIAFSSR
jgi:antitoxin CptB